MLVIMKIATVAQVALYCQPDAKVANGCYWFNFWMDLATKILS
jgi:hypothetical protein